MSIIRSLAKSGRRQKEKKDRDYWGGDFFENHESFLVSCENQHSKSFLFCCASTNETNIK